MKQTILLLFGVFFLLTLNLALVAQPLASPGVPIDPPVDPDGQSDRPEG